MSIKDKVDAYINGDVEDINSPAYKESMIDILNFLIEAHSPGTAAVDMADVEDEYAVVGGKYTEWFPLLCDLYQSASDEEIEEIYDRFL